MRAREIGEEREKRLIPRERARRFYGNRRDRIINLERRFYSQLIHRDTAHRASKSGKHCPESSPSPVSLPREANSQRDFLRVRQKKFPTCQRRAAAADDRANGRVRPERELSSFRKGFDTRSRLASYVIPLRHLPSASPRPPPPPFASWS